MARVASFPRTSTHLPHLADALDDFAQAHRLSFNARAVLADLILRVDPCRQALTATITAYAEHLGIPRRAVRKCFDELTEAGAIRWTPGSGGRFDGLVEVLGYDTIVYDVRAEP